MKQFRLVILLTSVAALLLGSVSAQQGDREAVMDVSQRWADLYNEGDIAGLADLYTENAVLYGNNGQVLEGREAIRAALQGAHDAAPGDMSRQSTNEVEVFGDTAYDIGSYTVTGTEGQTLSQGYYLTILKKIDGEWKIHRQIDNVTPGPEGTTG